MILKHQKMSYKNMSLYLFIFLITTEFYVVKLDNLACFLNTKFKFNSNNFYINWLDLYLKYKISKKILKIFRV